MAGSQRALDDQPMRRDYTAEQRAELIDNVAAGHETVVEAATRLGVAESTAYAWVRRAGPKTRRRDLASRLRKTAAVAAPTFVQLVRTGGPDGLLEVQIGAASLQVRRGFDAELLRAVVAALR